MEGATRWFVENTGAVCGLSVPERSDREMSLSDMTHDAVCDRDPAVASPYRKISREAAASASASLRANLRGRRILLIKQRRIVKQ